MTIRIIALIMASMAVFCATALEVAPGLLGRSLAGERDITELVISGSIDARDIATSLQQFASMAVAMADGSIYSLKMYRQ